MDEILQEIDDAMTLMRQALRSFARIRSMLEIGDGPECAHEWEDAGSTMGDPQFRCKHCGATIKEWPNG